MIRRMIGAIGLPALAGLLVLAGLAWLGIADAQRARFEFKPGMVFDYLVPAEGSDVQHHVRVVVLEVADGGYKVAIRMPEANVDATQTVSRADRVAGRCLPPRTYSGDATQAGCTSWVRVSDVIYRDLKAGRVTEIDAGPPGDTPVMTTHTGSGRVQFSRDGRPVFVRAVGGATSDGDSYAFNDDPAAPFGVYGLIEVWTPKTLGAKLTSDLAWTGRATTTALIFNTDGKLDPAAMELVVILADWLKANPGKILQMRVITDDLLGHDDAQALAKTRSSALAAAFKTQGIDSRTRLMIIAVGHDRWPTPERARFGQQERVDLRVIKSLPH